MDQTGIVKQKALPTAIVTRMMNDKISVSTTFSQNVNKELREYYRSHASYFWDKEKRMWYFPMQQETPIVNKLIEFGFAVTVNEYTPVVYIVDKGEQFEVSSDWDPNIFELVKSCAAAKWNFEGRHWTIPMSYIDTFLEILADKNIRHVLTRNLTTYKFTTSNPAKKPAVKKFTVNKDTPVIEAVE